MQIVATQAQRAHCPYCKDGLAGEVWNCPGCATTHHSACWNEHGGCVTLGCLAPRLPRADAARGIPDWRRVRLAEEAALDRAEAERRRIATEAARAEAERRRLAREAEGRRLPAEPSPWERALAAKRARAELEVTVIWAPDSPDLWLPERIHFAFGRLIVRSLGLIMVLSLANVLLGSSLGPLIRSVEFLSMFLGYCGVGWFASFLFWVVADDLREGDWS
jgi:hypothetical protein